MHARYDIALVAPQREMRVADGAAESLLRYLATTRIIQPTEEAIADTWCEVYAHPGPSAHDAFIRSGSYDVTQTPFEAFTIRFGHEMMSLGYGPQTDAIRFFAEFRGALFEQFTGRFRTKVSDIIGFNPDIMLQPHGALRPQRRVGADEAPKNRRLKRQHGGGPAGTRVEEF